MTRAFLAAYAAALLILLPRLSLWLDEILTLAGARQPDIASLLEYLKTVPGGTPLAFLIPHAAIELLGYSVFSSRLPSAVASVAACAGIYPLARRLGIRRPLIAVAVFAFCPLQFRYALEARPYALALCLSIWTTVVFFDLLDRPRSRIRIAAYALLTIASGLTLAYALFVPAAHMAWLIFRREHRRVALVCAASLAAAVLALLPWYLHYRLDWPATNRQQQLAQGWDWGAIQVFLKDLVGTGFLGTALVAIGVAFGLRRTGARSPWLLYLVAPILMVPVANAVFGYFFAIRQMIYALAPLSLLFAAGTEVLRAKGKFLLALFLAAALYEDVNWFRKPREDWQAAAQAIPAAGCVAFVPADADVEYTYFRPDLGRRQCPLGPPPGGGPVILAISPYDPSAAYAATSAALAGQGYRLERTAEFAGPRVELYRRR